MLSMTLSFIILSLSVVKVKVTVAIFRNHFCHLSITFFVSRLTQMFSLTVSLTTLRLSILGAIESVTYVKVTVTFLRKTLSLF